MNFLKTAQPRKFRPSLCAKLIALCSLSLTANQLMAQTRFDFGINIGAQTNALLNKNDQEAGDELNFKQKAGMTFGINGGYNFNNHMGVELGIIYSKQGQSYDNIASLNPEKVAFSSQLQGIAAYNNVALTGSYTASTGLTCIKIPVLFRYTGNNTKKAFFNSYIGPQINILSNAAYFINDNEMSLSKISAEPKDFYKKTSVDAVLGIGAGFNLSPTLLLTANLRLDYGLMDIEQKDATYTAIGIGGKPLFYPADRAATHQATGGLMVGLSYKMAKESAAAKAKAKMKAKMKAKKRK